MPCLLTSLLLLYLCFLNFTLNPFKSFRQKNQEFYQLKSAGICPQCRTKGIDPKANKCPQCGSPLDWRRRMNLGNTFLALMVALLSVYSIIRPIVNELRPKGPQVYTQITSWDSKTKFASDSSAVDIPQLDFDSYNYGDRACRIEFVLGYLKKDSLRMEFRLLPTKTALSDVVIKPKDFIRGTYTMLYPSLKVVSEDKEKLVTTKYEKHHGSSGFWSGSECVIFIYIKDVDGGRMRFPVEVGDNDFAKLIIANPSLLEFINTHQGTIPAPTPAGLPVEYH